MSQAILIVGESGSGKSTSIRNLEPEETAILNTINKSLPFKGGKKFNTQYSDNPNKICQWLEHISKNKPHIKNIIVDDFQYVMANEYMKSARTSKSKDAVFKMYDKIGGGAWDILDLAKNLRDDLFVFILTHSEMSETGKLKAKTIGQVLDNKVTLEGMFTVVLFTEVTSNGYYFLTTNKGGATTGKTPFDMFDKPIIPNDLKLVLTAINAYNEDDAQLSGEPIEKSLLENHIKKISLCGSENELKLLYSHFKNDYTNPAQLIDICAQRKAEILRAGTQTNESVTIH